VSDAIPIFAGPDGHAEDFYVPAFELHSRGRSLPEQVVRDATQVSYQDDLEKIDQVEITFNNWDAEKLDFSYSDADRFLPGRELILWLGYEGALRRLVTAEITAQKPSFPSGGQPVIAVSGLNVLHKFRRKQETHVYTNRTASQIAKEIGARLNIDMVTRPQGEAPYDYLIQDKAYDIVFLFQLARRSGYDIYVLEGADTRARPAVYFGPSPHSGKVVYKLRYGASLVEFQPTLTTTRQVGSVTVRGWDRRRKKAIEVTVKRSELGLGKVDDEIEPAFNQREDVVNVVVADEAEARQVARDRLRDIAHGTVTATGSTVGLPDLRAGSEIEVLGVGERYGGRYFVTATTHTLGGSGYTTTFTARRQ
jgi:phage protein D